MAWRDEDTDLGCGLPVADRLHARAAYHLVELLWAADLVDDSVLEILSHPCGKSLLRVELASSASGDELDEGQLSLF